MVTSLLFFGNFILVTSKNQMAIAHTSIMITLILLVMVIMLHLIRYTVISIAIKKFKGLVSHLLMYQTQYRVRTGHTRLPTDDDVELPPRPNPQELELAETAAGMNEEHIQNISSNNELAGKEKIKVSEANAGSNHNKIPATPTETQ